MNARPLATGLLALGAPALLSAQAPATAIDSGDTAWVLTSTALVLMMTAPGLALFYGGMVQKKNALTTIMHSFLCMALVTVQWVLVGYSLAFGPDKWGIIGSLEWRDCVASGSNRSPTPPRSRTRRS